MPRAPGPIPRASVSARPATRAPSRRPDPLGRAYTLARPVSVVEGPGTIERNAAATGEPAVAVVGAGTVATALAVLLERSGRSVVAASGREASRERVRNHLPRTDFLLPAEAAGRGRLVVIGLPDDEIATACSDIAAQGGFRPGQHVVHLSGSVGLSALDKAQDAGARVLSLHPLQSFPSVEEGIERFRGSGMAVTANNEEDAAFGEVLATDVGAVPFRLADDVKPLYHAAAVFGSNYLVAVVGVAERLFALSGLPNPRPFFAPLARTALEGALSRGAASALTGPAARGDVGTVARNLEALADFAPEALGAYVALARVSVSLAREAGRISEEERRGLEEVLSRCG